jgi:threonine synthase
MPKIVCSSCGKPYPADGLPYICEFCGGMFDYDAPFEIHKKDLRSPAPSLWMFRDSFAFDDKRSPVSLGEGSTPLLRRVINGEEIAFKMESNNPTGSYKDRGATTLVTEIAARDIPYVVEDSSGNAGASLATYCSWAGIDCKIFVPESASGDKLKQISRSNAKLQTVPGPRQNATNAVFASIKEQYAVYASHAYQPFYLPGIATIAYELYVAFGKAPGTVIIPVGHGGLFLGIMRGFDALYKQKIISKMPLLVGAQAMGYHPFVKHFHPEFGAQENTIDSLAEGVRITKPSRLSQIISMAEKVSCEFFAIENDDLEVALQECWKMGVYVEITSALVWAAYRNNLRKFPGPIVLIMSGSGLKY